MKLFFNLFLCTLFIISCSDNSVKTENKPDPAETARETDSLIIELTGRDSLTVFELLKEEHQLDYQTTLQGIFIKAIDSMANDDSHFWLYSVNDTMAQIACDKYVTSDGDKIRWIYKAVP